MVKQLISQILDWLWLAALILVAIIFLHLDGSPWLITSFVFFALSLSYRFYTSLTYVDYLNVPSLVRKSVGGVLLGTVGGIALGLIVFNVSCNPCTGWSPVAIIIFLPMGLVIGVITGSTVAITSVDQQRALEYLALVALVLVIIAAGSCVISDFCLSVWF